MSFKSRNYKVLGRAVKLYSSLKNNTAEGHTNYLGLFIDLSKYKALELNVYLALELALVFSLTYTTKCDHAGLRFNINLLGLQLELEIYDSRHWNDKKDRWYTPGEEQQEYLDEKST